MAETQKLNNFDLLRFLLAGTVAIYHAAILTNLSALVWLKGFLSASVAVDSFFIISGFLIFRSYDSSRSLTNYLGKRIRRVFPGYAAVVIVCSIFLFFVSSKELSEYFSLEFLRYLFFNLATLNFVQPTLPGVFETSAWPFVNASLWTIKIEVMFYLAVPFIATLLSRLNRAFFISAIYIGSILYSYAMIHFSLPSNQEIFLTLEKQLPGQMAYFISGAAIYYFYDRYDIIVIPLFIGSVLVLVLNRRFLDLFYLYPAALAVTVVFFAYKFKYLGNFGKFGDLSFGVYIWHFPMIQLFGHFEMFSRPVLGMALLLLCLLGVSFASWHLIEKRFLYRSSHYIVTEGTKFVP